MKLSAILVSIPLLASDDLTSALNRQDRGALDALVTKLGEAAARAPESADAHYRLAMARSALAQVAVETGDKKGSAAAAEAGIPAAQRATALKPSVAEYHRILGTLCGQVIPANPLAGLKWGKCAQEEVNRAVELDPKSAMACLSRGIGNYYLPAMFGGGVDKAIPDFQKAIQLDPRLADAHLWLGIALRKAGRNAEARASFDRALQINPARTWARQQLDKTPKQ